MGNTPEGAKRAYETQKKKYGAALIEKFHRKGGLARQETARGFARPDQDQREAARRSNEAQAVKRQQRREQDEQPRR